MSKTLLSLFDGSGGFPLAATMCGIKPVAASEVEPYPIAVTRSRFPNMKHLGSVTDINGAEIEPVDVITFGSPCQDLSVAGKRAGLKHTENGDEETTRSGLFMEAIRIIKEMREATNGVYPRFAVWENVPGAFSSNKGEDFRIVLEEFIKIVEPTAVMPTVPKNGWPYADSYCGDGWSISYRVFDAQFWGVPQRRRRIYLVADFGGQCAGKVSFEREGLRGYFAESGAQREAVAGDAENGIGAADRDGVAYGVTTKGNGDAFISEERHTAVSCGGGQAGQGYPCVMTPYHAVAYGISSYESNAMKSSNPHSGIYEADTARTLDLNGGNPACNQGGIAVVGAIPYYEDGTVPTLVAKDPSAVAYWDGPQVCGTLTANNAGGSQRMPDKENFNCVIEADVSGVDCRNGVELTEQTNALQAVAGHSVNGNNVVRVKYIVRRLTPTECARLQGFPDHWGHPDVKKSLSDDEYRFWLEVRNTHAEINGKAVKEYTKTQMLTWYNKLHTDSSEYKMWGNGIALPCALYVMQGIAEVLGGTDLE